MTEELSQGQEFPTTAGPWQDALFCRLHFQQCLWKGPGGWRGCPIPQHGSGSSLCLPGALGAGQGGSSKGTVQGTSRDGWAAAESDSPRVKVRHSTGPAGHSSQLVGVSTSLGAHVEHMWSTRGCRRMRLCPAEKFHLTAWHSLPPAAIRQWQCLGLGNVSCRERGWCWSSLVPAMRVCPAVNPGAGAVAQ